jgi:tetratricopeptide (TPR) repeat protein
VSRTANRTPSATAELEAERDFLLRSLEDLDEEHSAGEVGEDDYERLKNTYTVRAAEVLRALGVENADKPPDSRAPGTAGPLEPAKVTTGTRNKRGLLIGGILCILAGIGVAVLASDTGSKLPGNTITGSVNLAPQQQADRELEQAAVYEQAGNDAQALQLFDDVLSKFPNNVTALASAGWIEFEAGVTGRDTKSLEQGETDESKAVRLDPTRGTPHAYLGTMYFVEGQTEEAVIQYAQFLATNPSAADMSPFVPDMKKAYLDNKSPLPKALSGS